ncbi:MAG: transporter [Halobacteriovorax sp.]|nr:transporter [Halobacteriovorax sp.]
MVSEQILNEIYKLIFDPTIGKIVSLIVVGIIILLIKKSVINYFNKRITSNTLKYRTRKSINFIATFVFVLGVTVTYNEKLSGLTMAFGVAGAGIAFALQEVIASIAGWAAISFGDFFKIGDRVQLGGIRGDVIDIGILRTTMMEIGGWVDGDLYNGRIVRISNSFVFKDPVFNYSSEFPFLWDEITIPIRHGSDIDKTKELMQSVANHIVKDIEDASLDKWSSLVNKFMVEDARVRNMVTMTANENWMNFTLRYVVDYKQRRITKDKLFTGILKGIELDSKITLACSTLEITKV